MITTTDIEVEVAKYFGIRQNIIIPRASYGLGLHECDLLIVSKSGYCTEVEIKISVSDFKNEFKKKHEHKSDKIKYFYYALPPSIYEKVKDLITADKGVLIIEENLKTKKIKVKKEKPSLENKKTKPLAKEFINKALDLGILRVWNLKEKLNKLQKQSRNDKRDLRRIQVLDKLILEKKNNKEEIKELNMLVKQYWSVYEVLNSLNYRKCLEYKEKTEHTKK